MVSKKDKELIEAAAAAVRIRYRNEWQEVGAAMRTRDGRIITGVNIDAYLGRNAVCAEAIAIGRAVGVSLIGAATLFIAIVGIVYSLVLRALWNPDGWQKVADMGLHDAVPLLAVAFWFAFVPKGGLAWRDPVIWLAFPLAYFVHALLRGATTGWWAYPFLNADALGHATVLRNAVILTAAFLGLGLVLVALDRTIGGRAR